MSYLKGQEVTIKIINKLDILYGDIFDQSIARQAIEEVLYDYNIEDKPTSLAVIDNMSDMILMYLATRKTEGLADSTLKGYGRTIGRFANFIKKNVEDVTAMDVRIYIANRSKQGLKNTTLANDTDVLRGFFSFLEDEEYIDKSPMRKVKTVKVEKRLREALTKEQFETLRLGAKTLRQKALLEFFYATGCRLDEVVNVNKSDIDWQKLSLNVIGKGNKERTVFLNATVQVHLKKYLMSRLDDSDALFVTIRKPIGRLGKRAIQKEINMISEQSGIKINIFPHILRHTFATHMINSGMSLTVLQEIMGHDSPDTTMVYSRISNASIESEYRKYS